MSREEQVSQWRALVEEQVASGLSAAAFCREQEINVQRFYEWRRRFFKQSFKEMANGFIELVPCSRHPHSGVRIRVKETVYVEVERGFDPFTLRAVVEAIIGDEKKPCSP